MDRQQRRDLKHDKFVDEIGSLSTRARENQRLLLTIAAAAVSLLRPIESHAQAPSPLGGVWALNRSLSEMPRELGFNVNWFPPPTAADGGQPSGSNGGGRGRRGSSGGSRPGSVFTAPRENYLDAQRLQAARARQSLNRRGSFFQLHARAVNYHVEIVGVLRCDALKVSIERRFGRRVALARSHRTQFLKRRNLCHVNHKAQAHLTVADFDAREMVDREIAERMRARGAGCDKQHQSGEERCRCAAAQSCRTKIRHKTFDV